MTTLCQSHLSIWKDLCYWNERGLNGSPRSLLHCLLSWAFHWCCSQNTAAAADISLLHLFSDPDLSLSIKYKASSIMTSIVRREAHYFCLHRYSCIFLEFHRCRCYSVGQVEKDWLCESSTFLRVSAASQSFHFWKYLFDKIKYALVPQDDYKWLC